jgi:hypothetical protein
MKRNGLTALGRLVMFCGLALASPACATIIHGTTQDLHIDSEPQGASCKVDRAGAATGVVDRTPGKVTVKRHKDSIVVSCALDGYEPSSEVLTASFNALTMGNLVLPGGTVGFVVDASTGANNKYPARTVVVMTPATFPNEPARDAYYAGVKARLEEAAAAEVRRITGNCPATGRELCQIEARNAAEARDKAVAEVEQKRLTAKIMPSG